MYKYKEYNIGRLCVNFFIFLKSDSVCFVVAICNLLHNVEKCGNYILHYLTAKRIWKSFLKYE